MGDPGPPGSGRLSTALSGWRARLKGSLQPAMVWLSQAPVRPGRPGTPERSGFRISSERGGLALLATGIVFALWLAAGWWLGDGLPFLPWVLFGWGAPILALALIAGGVSLALANRLGWQSRWWAVASAESLFIALLVLLQLGLAEGRAAALRGEGGGLVGWAVGFLLQSMLGVSLAWLATLLWALASAWLLWLSLPLEWTDVLRTKALGLGRWLGALLRSARRHGTPQEPATPDRLPPRVPAADAARRRSASRPGPPAPTPGAPAATAQPDRPPHRKTRLPSLPPFDILEAGAGRPGGNSDARQQAQLLRQTLAEFGVPVEIVSIKEGPTVTQFGLEPGEIVREAGDGEIQRRRVSVNRILRLSNDLALALAAPSIRIEAPVPGRPYVGVEIPNLHKTLVALRPVLESKDFARLGSPLAVALGRDVAGDAVVLDLARMPHVLIAGATGSGKSVCINAIITSLLMNNGPERLRLLMVDPKMVELPVYNGVPHLVAPVVTDVTQATGALAWLTLQMDERYRLFAEAGVRNIQEYNRRPAKGRSREILPFLVLVIDELADLMLIAAYDVERQICRLAQMSRATGIHLVLATQRPSVDVITGLIKANFPARIAFAVATQIDSRVILDGSGAERLLGRGDMLLMTPESARLLRVQGCFVSDEEIDRLVGFWKGTVPADERVAPKNLPWAGLLEQMEGRDELLDRALELLHGKQQVSTSLLQRQLRIGYPRAARLIEQLQDLGIVGPDEGGGRSRQVLLDSTEPPDEEGGEPL